MTNTKNAAGYSTPAAPQQASYTQDYTINPEESKEEIHRSPIKLQRHPDQLPATLKHLNQWCLTSHNKIPLNAAGYKIDVTNPANYLPFDEAITALSTVTCAAGVGFILTSSNNIVIVDVDHCIDVTTGEMNDVAKELLKLIPSYTELSQSRTGLHLIFSDNDIPVNFSGKKGVVEVYTSQRYFALTGWKITDRLADIVTLNGMTKHLLENYFPISDFTTTGDEDVLEQHSYTPIQSDEQVLQSLQSNQKFQRLFYQGDISGYPSQSEADGALMLILAEATSLNADQMRRLFSQSALGKRDKWVQRKWYQNYLIAGAIRFVESKEDNNMNDITLGEYLQTVFKSEQAQYSTISPRKTGFVNLDNKMKGFPPGVYCLTAISSAGKTAFSIQLGHQLALQGETIIYVGYETTRLEVCSRILSRIMKQFNPSSQFSAYDIRMSECIYDPYYKAAIQSIYDTHPNFMVWSIQDTIPELLNKLQKFMAEHPKEKPPIVIIDYLQIIPHTGELKRVIDENLPKIKSFQQSTGTTFLIISSSNRASYRSDMGVEAFKESGIIEFSADVIWVLQYSALSSISTIDNTRLKLEKARSPRKMTLKCLKNRFGADYEVSFDYHSKFDWFVETSVNTEDDNAEWKTATPIH